MAKSKTFDGEVHGHLTFPPRGSRGFGYDPIFIADGMRADLRRDRPAGEARHEPSRPGLREAAAQRHPGGIVRRPVATRRSIWKAPPAPRQLGARFGIYVHWPFCAAKCPYCDFNSHVRTAIDEAGWVDAIVRELDWTAASARRRSPHGRNDFLRRRHAVADAGPLGRRACSTRSRACGRWPTTSRSRWKPIPPAPTRRASPITAPPASTACRWACRR